MKKKITAKERAEKAVEKSVETFLKMLCKVTGCKYPENLTLNAPKTDDNEEGNENVH